MRLERALQKRPTISLGVVSPCCCRFIHARSERTRLAEAERKLERPVERYRSPGNKTRPWSNNDSRFVLAPTSWKSQFQGTSEWRREAQMAKTSASLLACLQDAIRCDAIDHSVFSAAMQRCGQAGWWEVLKRVHELQMRTDTKPDLIVQSAYLTAMAKCMRPEKGIGDVAARQREALTRAKNVWNEFSFTPECASHQSLNIFIGAVFHLCIATQQREALTLAEKVWEWAEEKCIRVADVPYETWTTLNAQHRRYSLVDKLLEAGVKKAWKPSVVGLGALVNAAGEQRDWERAELMWTKLVDGVGLEPHMLAYNALAKAHLLCGRPFRSAEVLDKMLNNGISPNYKVAESHAVALLIVYHSSLKESDHERLCAAIGRVEPALTKTSSLQRKTWTQIRSLFDNICEYARQVRLHDILALEWKAGQSVMGEWPNYPAGSRYLEVSSE